MNRTKQKQMKIGWQLFISRSGGAKGTFEPVGGVFETRYAAEQAQKRSYSSCAYRVRGLRWNIEPMSTKSDSFENRNKSRVAA